MRRLIGIGKQPSKRRCSFFWALWDFLRFQSKIPKMAQAALVEDFNRMVARQAREAATLSAAVWTVLPARCCAVHDEWSRYPAPPPGQAGRAVNASLAGGSRSHKADDRACRSGAPRDRTGAPERAAGMGAVGDSKGPCSAISALRSVTHGISCRSCAIVTPGSACPILSVSIFSSRNWRKWSNDMNDNDSSKVTFFTFYTPIVILPEIAIYLLA